MRLSFKHLADMLNPLQLRSSEGEGRVLPRRGFIRRTAGFIAGLTGVAVLQRPITAAAGESSTSPVPNRITNTLGSDPFVGEIEMFAGNFAPTGWAFCDGSLLPISQNTALFSLLGVMYGGNGSTNFALPDLRGRAPMGYTDFDGSPGTPYGESSHMLTTAEIPAHGHALTASSQTGTGCKATEGTPAVNAEGSTHYSATADATMASGVLAGSGQGLAHNNMQPYLGVSFIIALQGVFPPRP